MKEQFKTAYSEYVKAYVAFKMEVEYMKDVDMTLDAILYQAEVEQHKLEDPAQWLNTQFVLKQIELTDKAFKGVCDSVNRLKKTRQELLKAKDKLTD